MRKFNAFLNIALLIFAISVISVPSNSQTPSGKNKKEIGHKSSHSLLTKDGVVPKTTAEENHQVTRVLVTNPPQWFFLTTQSNGWGDIGAVATIGPFRNIKECQEIKDWVANKYHVHSSRCWQGSDSIADPKEPQC